MKPSVLVKSLAGIGCWLIAHLVLAEPLIAPTAIDWLLDCPLPPVARLDPEVLERTQCGWVMVPRDYAAPERGRVRLTLTRVGARQPLSREGVVFIQAGEPPKAQGSTFVLHLVSRWESFATPAYRTLVDRYDVIELSPRNLKQENGIEQAARDMEFVRGQLGDAHLNYLGNAEATRLGSRYGTLFPERVARMVLINAERDEPIATGVEQLLLKASTSTLADDCVNRWLGDFMVYGKQPRTSVRCLDRGAWE
ncbi:alpha/beta fold hydrolase [Pseudomonas sp. MWU15-20650]|uniref:alpha/beta fold hydrolase n=1 Tax=Pseudomonas sp. MWU15-20650 TaxID=2933107 RepID=UPI00200E5B27|nr:alpha/beta fold hydrolase [Pseudomonas sp. MWU15-20650]